MDCPLLAERKVSQASDFLDDLDVRDLGFGQASCRENANSSTVQEARDILGDQRAETGSTGGKMFRRPDHGDRIGIIGSCGAQGRRDPFT